MEPKYKNPIAVRGDCLYCPLPLSINSYWNCLTDCHHCWIRHLNQTWGTELRPAEPEAVRHKLYNGLNNNNPKSSLAWALKRKKTIRVGNFADPYQDIELEMHITRDLLKILIDLKWSFVIQTRFTANLELDEDLLTKAHKLGLLTLTPVITPGGEQDWIVLERGRTTAIPERLKIIRRWINKGWNVGVNGEPFIPGVHTTKQFRETIKRLKEIGVQSYNTYNLHFNGYVARRLANIGLDIGHIWYMNKQKEWFKIQRELCIIAKEENIRLGCPDFVSTGPHWIEQANTCCGVNVPNPSQFNTHWWKKKMQRGATANQVYKETWEGIGDKHLAKAILRGTSTEHFTMREARMI